MVCFDGNIQKGIGHEDIKKPRKKRGVKEQKYSWEIKEFTKQS